MRPLSLEMTAFGAYAEKTLVPFEDLRQGLYLVTGDTGAGKTTIFDAIMFALYGTASGTERSPDMLHSDHVPKSDDTVVKLRFRQGGKEYTVERRLHFSKIKGAENQYREGKPDALLTEPDRDPTEGAKKVTARVEALLGLNAEQFRKIIMLAQGEFREFLNADSDKKNEILGRLFDSAPYLFYQNLLAGARDELKNRRAEKSEALRTLMQSTFQVPPDLSPEEGEGFLPGNPALPENLRRLTERDQSELAALSGRRDAFSAQIAGLNAQKGAAEADNAQLAELERARQSFAALEAAKPEIARRRAACALAEKALHRVKPALEQAQRTKSEYAAALSEIEALKTRLAAYQREAEAAAEAVLADAGSETELAALSARLQELEGQLPRYADLAKREREKLTERKAAEQTDKTLQKERGRLGELEREQESLREKLLSLENADSEAQEAVHAEERARERLQSLDGKEGIREKTAALLEEEEKLHEREAHLRALTLAAARTEERYSVLYRRFIAGQAGLLAGELRRTLETEGAADCPVCRTKLQRGQIPRLAVCAEETPDQKTVDKARKAHEQAERERSEESTAAAALQTSIEAGKKALLEKAGGLLPDCGDWESLAAEGYLSAAVAEAKERSADAQEALKRARERQTERLRCKERQPELEKLLQNTRDRIEELKQTLQRHEAASQAAEAAITELKKQLPYADAAAANGAKTLLVGKRQQLSEKLRAHRSALDEANSRLNTARGGLNEKETAAQKRLAARTEAECALAARLRENGFADAEAVLQALAPAGDGDAEDWLKAEERAFAAHEEALRHTAERISDLVARTAGKEPADLAALDAQLKALTAAYNEANSACTQKSVQLQNHTDVLEKAEGLLDALRATEGAWERLDKLAALAVGSSGEGGKLSFDRYVMGAVFREILEMANRRMELMSGGRYELIHKSGADRRNAKAGLEIEVLDNSTGQLRPAASLSGGEGFFTSLALALGLSDVAQGHAGGKRMDALFIDEGFGTLSDDALDRALEALNALTEGERLVGIISHVDRLNESIPQKICVRSGEKGSSLALTFASF